MSIESDIYDAIKTFASGNVYRDIAPNNISSPYIVISVIDIVPENTLDNSNPSCVFMRIQVDVITSTRVDCNTLSSSIISAMTTASFGAIWLSSQPAHDDILNVARNAIEFSIIY